MHWKFHTKNVNFKKSLEIYKHIQHFQDKKRNFHLIFAILGHPYRPGVSSPPHFRIQRGYCEPDGG